MHISETPSDLPSLSPTALPTISPVLSFTAVEQDTAKTSVTIKSQTTVMDDTQIPIFESVALEFLKKHYTRVLDSANVEFKYVQVTHQVPVPASGRRRMETGDPAEGKVLLFLFDLEVFFEVGAVLRPGNNLLVDLQWLVDSLFQINLDDFFRQLDKAGALQPSAIESFDNDLSASSTETVESGFFNTWVIASLGAVVFSVFLTGMLVTRVVRRTRDREFFSTATSSDQSHLESVSRSKMVSIFLDIISPETESFITP
jgi:hypothetical protein